MTTGTASGKSLAFNLPVLDAIAREPKTRALYLYPTKALAQDQARGLSELRLKGLKPAIYDGDTPPETRWQVRKWSNAILTNPDMLHVGVLPHHDRWGDVLAQPPLRRRGRGARVPRRLRLPRGERAPAAATARPLSTTPSRSSCSPRRRSRTPASWRRRSPASAPPWWSRTRRAGRARGRHLEPAAPRPRARPASEPSRGGSRLLSQLTTRGLRTICFAKSRKAAELIHRFTVERVDAATARRLAPYRAGYTPEQRRDIERRLVEGSSWA